MLDSPTDSGPTVAGCYDFGGVAVTLASKSRHWARLARRRYGAFAVDRPAAWRVVYRVTDRRCLGPRSLYEGRAQTLCARRRRERLELAAPSFELKLDRRRQAAELAGPLATYPVDRLIPALWYETVPRGLVFHGAALAADGRGWLATGPSGCGKSTLASLLPEQTLCDELAAVRLPDSPPATARVDRPRLTALPFWNGRPGTAELTGIYLLRHGRRDRRRALQPGEAFARLRRQVVWPTYDLRALERAFDTLAQLLGRVGVWELAFRPRPAVWDVIREAA